TCCGDEALQADLVCRSPWRNIDICRSGTEVQVWNSVGGQAAPNPQTHHGNLASKTLRAACFVSRAVPMLSAHRGHMAGESYLVVPPLRDYGHAREVVSALLQNSMDHHSSVHCHGCFEPEYS